MPLLPKNSRWEIDSCIALESFLALPLELMPADVGSVTPSVGIVIVVGAGAGRTSVVTSTVSKYSPMSSFAKSITDNSSGMAIDSLVDPVAVMSRCGTDVQLRVSSNCFIGGSWSGLSSPAITCQFDHVIVSALLRLIVSKKSLYRQWYCRETKPVSKLRIKLTFCA